MKPKQTETKEDRRVIHPTTYHVRHDSGDSFEVHGLTLARIRKLIKAECEDRGWLMDDIDWWVEPPMQTFHFRRMR
jgi:hypothetical protein